MKGIYSIFSIVIIILLTGIFIFTKHPSQEQEVDIINIDNSMSNLKLTSSAFENNKSIPSKYTCDGNDISPPLSISGAPEGTKSLVLIMDDPDAIKPAGKVWDHWIVWNIPPTTTGIPEGQEPVGVHGTGTGGNNDYSGPCPPDAEHHYFFKLYALDIMLDVAEGASKADIEQAMESHIIQKTELIGSYERQ